MRRCLSRQTTSRQVLRACPCPRPRFYEGNNWSMELWSRVQLSTQLDTESSTLLSAQAFTLRMRGRYRLCTNMLSGRQESRRYLHLLHFPRPFGEDMLYRFQYSARRRLISIHRKNIRLQVCTSVLHGQLHGQERTQPRQTAKSCRIGVRAGGRACGYSSIPHS